MTEPDLNSISAAMRRRDWADAERLARSRLAESPEHEKLLGLLAISQQLQHKAQEAAETYTRLTNLSPANSAHWNNYATALREVGRVQDARHAYAEAVRLDPRNTGAHVNLGLMLIKTRDYAAARDALLNAFDIEPASPLVRIHAARACSLCQDFQGADDLLKPWRQWLPLGDAALQTELAHLLLQMTDANGARMLLEDLVQRAPANAGASLFLAHVHERLNRLDDAEALIRSVLESGRPMDDAVRLEADHGFATLLLRKGDAAAARALLEQTGPRNDRDALHYFKLAESCDKLAERGAAMRMLETAHALQVAELKETTPDYFAANAAALPAVLAEVSAEAYARWPVLSAPDARDSPVFVVGFPRSGTTLLEQMLDSHPRFQSMDENPFFNRLADTLRRHDPRVLEDLSVLRQLDCDELRKRYALLVSEKIPRRRDTQLIDKNPLNMLWLPLIHRLFPAARYILAVRHPCDVILSCYMQNFRSSILIAASADLDRLARAYVAAMEFWLRHAKIFQPNVMVSRYEDLIADTSGQTRRIADFLEVEDASPMLGFDQRAREKGYIATPSYSQVIEPVNRKGLNRWHHYREVFEPLLPILAPMLRHWGYPDSQESEPVAHDA